METRSTGKEIPSPGASGSMRSLLTSVEFQLPRRMLLSVLPSLSCAASSLVSFACTSPGERERRSLPVLELVFKLLEDKVNVSVNHSKRSQQVEAR